MGDAGGYPRYHPGFMQVERGSDPGGKSNAGSHPSIVVDTAQVFGVKLHGISEGKRCDDDIRASRKSQVQVRQPTLLGHRVLRQHGRLTGEGPEEVYSRARETGSDRGQS